MRTTIIALAIITSSMAYGQKAAAKVEPVAKPEQKEETRSRMESMLLKRGTFIVKKFTKIGTIKGIGIVEVQLLTIHEGDRSYSGLHITITGNNKYDSGSVAFLDPDEMDSLSQALARMADSSDSILSSNGSTEMLWVARGGLTVGVVGEDKEVNGVFRTGASTAYPPISSIREFQQMVSKAKSLMQ